MMKSEFESIAGRPVTSDQYHHIEQLYYESDLNKYDFVKSIKPLLKSIPVPVSRSQLVMAVHNAYGDMLTPNHAYYMTVKVELIDVNIKTGKRTVKAIPGSFDFRTSCDITDWDRDLVIIGMESIYE